MVGYRTFLQVPFDARNARSPLLRSILSLAQNTRRPAPKQLQNLRQGALLPQRVELYFSAGIPFTPTAGRSALSEHIRKGYRAIAGPSKMLARHRRRGLYRFTPGRGSVEARPKSHRPRQLRHRPRIQPPGSPLQSDASTMEALFHVQGRHPQSANLQESGPQSGLYSASGRAWISSVIDQS